MASSQGHEAAQLGAVWAMRTAPDAAYFPYYRDLGMMIALGVSPLETLLGFMAKKGETFSGARQFPLHGARPDLKLFNLSNVISTQIPHAVGYALGCKMSGGSTVTMTTFGDGGASAGDFHEGMNFAAVHSLPMLFFCENNRYAISVPMSKQMAIEDIADRAAGYGMPGVIVDGTDILATYQATREAVDRAVRGDGPTLIEAKVERYLPHTSDDDDSRYRPGEEIEEARKRDPLIILSARLKSMNVLDDSLDEQIRDQARQTVNAATDAVEAAPYPGAEDFYKHVYASGPGGAA